MSEQKTQEIKPEVVENKEPKKPEFVIMPAQVYQDLMTFLGALPHNTVKNVIVYLEKNASAADLKKEEKEEKVEEPK